MIAPFPVSPAGPPRRLPPAQIRSASGPHGPVPAGSVRRAQIYEDFQQPDAISMSSILQRQVVTFSAGCATWKVLLSDNDVGWSAGFAAFVSRFAARFPRVESRRQMRIYVRGLLSESQRKNGWTLAEAAGDPGPERMQRLLNFYAWDSDGVRDDLRAAVVEALEDASDGVLIVGETSFLKKGNKSAGVARQYSGTAGRLENAQIG